MKKTKKTKSLIPVLFSSHELRSGLIWTLGILLLFRLGAYIPLPLVPTDFLAGNPDLMQTLINMYDLLSAGSLSTLSVFALGIGPYISASIIVQLLSSSGTVPKLAALKEEGAYGQRMLKRITHYLAAAVAFIESIGLIKLLAAAHLPALIPFPMIAIIVSLCLMAGAMLSMFLAEKISEKGIGNGSSLLICVGIISRIPKMVQDTLLGVNAGSIKVWELCLMLSTLFLAGAMAFVLQQRMFRLKVLGGRKAKAGKLPVPETELYLPCNPAGVMPIILASQFMFMAQLALQFVWEKLCLLHDYFLVQNPAGEMLKGIDSNTSLQSVFLFILAESNNCFDYSHWEYYVVYTIIILFFAPFYSEISLPARDIAESLRRSQRALEGVKPGVPTYNFLRKKIQKLSLLGACAVAVISILPAQVAQLTHVQTLLGMGSTSLIILTGVAADTKRQISACISSTRTHKRYLISPEKNQSEENDEHTG